jgi:hypothetical protein
MKVFMSGLMVKISEWGISRKDRVRRELRLRRLEDTGIGIIIMIDG